MTTQPPLARVPRHFLPLRTSSALVVALLLFGVPLSAGPMDGIALTPPTLVRASTIDGTVSAVTGTVLDVIGGQFRIDVANATITNGDDPVSGPFHGIGIPVGARIVAQVPVGDALPTVFPPPPFQATSVSPPETTTLGEMVDAAGPRPWVSSTADHEAPPSSLRRR